MLAWCLYSNASERVLLEILTNAVYVAGASLFFTCFAIYVAWKYPVLAVLLALSVLVNIGVM